MITLQTASGTVVPMDEANETVAKFTDLNMVAENLATWMEEEGVSFVRFGDENDEQVIRRDNTQQAITAATDHLLYGRYDHPETTEGLHIYSNSSLEGLHGENIGVIHSDYVGSLMIGPEPDNGYGVWHQIGLRRGNLYHSPIPRRARSTKSVKHDFVDYILMGYSLKVWVANIRPYFAIFLTQWLEPDIEVAAAFRDQRLAKERVRRQVIKPAGRRAYKMLNSSQDRSEVVVPDEIYFESVDGEAIELFENGKQEYKLYSGGVPQQVKEFDPDNLESVLVWNDFAESSVHFTIEPVA